MMGVVTSTAPGSVIVEPATWRDLNALRYLEKVCFPVDAWPLLDLIALLAWPNIVRLKAVSGEDMVGFIAGDIRHSEDEAWITTLGVLPAYRGQGIGGKLLQACEALLAVSSIRLSVRASNRAAIHLYQRFGYAKVGEWPNYYRGGELAIVMGKRL